MSIFSFHLVETTVMKVASALFQSPTLGGVPGLRHSECMTMMKLGAPILSPARAQISRLAVFIWWDSDEALRGFLERPGLGTTLAGGWHVRLEFLRRWGFLSEFDGLPEQAGRVPIDAPVVAVTLARLRLLQVPRFVRWGKPVESQVRDHPGTTLALAAMRPIRTISTFTVWRSQREMLSMVTGQVPIQDGNEHAVAMDERERQDFHHEFTTLRFRALSEHGEWEGRRGFVPS